MPDLPEWLAPIRPGWRGLEIGPLDKPVFTRPAWDVRYVDHDGTEALRAKYADDDAMRDRLDEIVDVDVVWSGDRPLAELLGDERPIDFVFASHVVEHVPDLVGWLRELASVLRDGGLVCLAVPDMRLCFDVNRNPTDLADVVDAHLRGLKAPGYRQIFDFHANIVAVDAAELWAGTADHSGSRRTDVDPDAWAFELCLRHRDTGEYVDGHCHAFTPATFLDLYSRMAGLGLVEYRITSFEPSRPGTIEFRVVLEKLPADMSADERLAAQLASVPEFVDTVPAAPSHTTPGRPDGEVQTDAGAPRSEPGRTLVPGQTLMALSPREERLLAAKRRIGGAVASVRQALRRPRSLRSPGADG